MPDNDLYIKVTIRLLRENFMYLKSYCALNGMYVQTFIDKAIREKLKRDEKKKEE